jgi:hypothetical protein
MKIEVALRKRDRAISRVQDAFGSAECFAETSRQLTERILTIKDQELRGCPAWVGAYVDGYVAAKHEYLDRHKLVHGVWDGITFYSTHRNRPDYYENHITIREYAQLSDRYENTANKGIYWGHKPERPWFTGADWVAHLAKKAEAGL